MELEDSLKRYARVSTLFRDRFKTRSPTPGGAV
jgi:hypothetical protein